MITLSSIFHVTFHGLCILFLVLGVFDVFLNYEPNQCEMTYMWEFPRYAKVPFHDNVTDKHPRYGLYLYGEGQHFKHVSKLELEGTPVLYIPGNGGSMKQVRSLGSVLLRKAEQMQWRIHFNVFSIDFNEELVAFDGSMLENQVDFLHRCINKIFTLYDHSKLSKPTSVVLVGHSMGGVIARALFSIPDFDSRSVSFLLTLSSPHLYPVINLDVFIASFYRDLSSHWNQDCSLYKDLTIVSISGGCRDFQVNDVISRLPDCGNNFISVSSTSVPRAWVSTDHQASVWCKQVVLVTARALFDMAELGRGQMTDDVSARTQIARYHFERNPGTSSYSEYKTTKIKLLSSYARTTITQSCWNLSIEKDFENSMYFMFNIKHFVDRNKTLLVVRTTTSKSRWIMACSSDNCSSATDLSGRGYLSPKFKIFKATLKELVDEAFTHVVLSVPKKKKEHMLDINFLQDEEYLRNITMPHILSSVWTFYKGYGDIHHFGSSTPLQFYYRLNINELHNIYYVYKASLAGNDGLSEALIELSLEDNSSKFGSHGTINVQLHRPGQNLTPTLMIFTDGQNEFDIKVKVQFTAVIGQIIRFHGVSLISMLVINVMLAYSYQLKLLLCEGSCPSTAESHQISAKPYKIQPFISLVKVLYGYEAFSQYWGILGLPNPDAVEAADQHKVWFSFAPFFTFLFAYEMFSLILFVQDKLFKLFGKLLSRIQPYSNVLESEASFKITFIHIVLLAVSASVSGGVTLFLICFLSWMDLCRLYPIVRSSDIPVPKDTKETNTSDPKQLNSEAISKFNVKLTQHYMWLFLALLSVPSIIRFVKENRDTSPDPTLAYAAFASLLFLTNNQLPISVKPTRLRRLVQKIIFPLVVLSAILCMHSLYRLPIFILLFMSLHVAVQCFD